MNLRQIHFELDKVMRETPHGELRALIDDARFLLSRAVQLESTLAPPDPTDAEITDIPFGA